MTLRTAWSVLLVSLGLTYAAVRVRWGVGSAGTSWPAGPLSPHKIFHPRLLRGMAVSSQHPKRVKVVASTVTSQKIYHILFVKAHHWQSTYKGWGNKTLVSRWMKQWSHSTEAYALYRRGLGDMAKTPIWCGVSAEGLKSKENLPRAPDCVETEHWENWVDELLQIQLKPLESASESVI